MALCPNLRLMHTQTHERVHYQHTQPLDGPLSQHQADAHTDASMFIINTHNRLMALCPNLRLMHTQTHEHVHYQHTQPLDGPLSQPQADAHTDA